MITFFSTFELCSILILSRNDGKKKEEFCRRWEKQLNEKQKELDRREKILTERERSLSEREEKVTRYGMASQAKLSLNTCSSKF